MSSFSGDQVANREKVMFCVETGRRMATLRHLMGVRKEGGRAVIERIDRREFVLCDHFFMFQGAGSISQECRKAVF